MRARRIGAVLALTAGGVLLAAGPASAAEAPAAAPASAPALLAAPWDDNCATAPDVDAPVIGGIGTATPSRVRGNDVSMFQQYGLTGLNYFTYDLGDSNVAGCLPNGDSIAASSQTMIGNFFFQAAKGIVMVDDMVLRRAYTSDWMWIFDPFVSRAVTSLHDAVFAPWGYAALTLLGLLVLAKAYKGSLNDATARAGTAIVVLVAAFLIVAEPVTRLHQFYDGMDQATVEITTSITGQKAADGSAPGPADAMIATLHKAMLYRAWLEGELGDADSATAQKYGPQLLAATAMTYDEAKLRGTDAYAKLVEKKQGDFKDIAEKIKTEDPVAYSYLQGKHSDARPSTAIRSIIGTSAASPILLAGALAMMMSKLIALFVIVMSMIVLVGALVRGSLGMDLLDRVLSGALTALIWCAALPLSMLLNDAALNNSKLDSISSIVILVAVNTALFIGAKAIAPGYSGVLRRRHARRGAHWGRLALQTAAGFFGARAGAAVAGATQQAQPEVAEGAIDPDPGTTRPLPDVDGEDWTREPVGASRTTARALPEAPLTPDNVTRPSDAATHGLPTPQQESAPKPEQPGGSEYRPTRRDGNTEVYDIYSGAAAPDDVPAESTGAESVDSGSDGPLALGGAE